MEKCGRNRELWERMENCGRHKELWAKPENPRGR